MSHTNDGGPAYPHSRSVFNDGGFAIGGYIFDGMSLRDHFAGQALVGYLSQMQGMAGGNDPRLIARTVWAIADAMIVERGMS